MEAPLVGKQLRDARKRAGLTQAELGAKVGISGSAVGQWEQGKTTPSWKQAQKVAEVLGVAALVPEEFSQLRDVVELQARVTLLLAREARERSNDIDELDAMIAALVAVLDRRRQP